MQELGKFNFKINVMPNKLEKYMSFNISNNSFQFLSSLLDNKYCSQQFDTIVLDLVKQKEFYPY